MKTDIFSSRERDDLIPLADTGFYSTAENLSAEKSFLSSLQNVQKEKARITFPAEWLARKRTTYFELKKDRMDPTELQEQLTVVYDQLSGDERVAIITGPPGAAKTVVATLWVKLAREHDANLPVILMTQERPALHRLHEKLSFQEAQLLLLTDVLEKKIDLISGAIVILDEAGLLGTQTLATILEKIAETDPVKIILIGDDKQLLPCDSGQPFRWLRERKKVAVSELSFPYRQKDPALRQIVLDLYSGKIEDALSRLSLDFLPHDEIMKTARAMIDELAPEKSLVLVHDDGSMINRLRVVCPGYRTYSLAAAQGLAVDEALLILAAPINLSEFLVGCSRARHHLRIVIDQDIYPDQASLIESIRHYPKKLMALDMISEEKLLEIIDQA